MAAAVAAADLQGAGNMLTFIVIFLAVLIALWYYLSFNTLVKSQNACDQSWSNIEVELKRRLDLIDNLVSVTKGYSTHEQETLIKTVQARNTALKYTNATEANQSLSGINESLKSLFALAESYPDLKAADIYRNLQTELATSENRIAERRSAYNQCVNLYSNALLTFPSNLVASIGNFTKRDFFDAPDEINQTPKVSL